MLNISLLDNAKQRGGRTITACPVCRAAGNDRQGNHLVIYESGKFGCVANEGDSAHRSEIFSLVGIREDTSDTSKSELAARARRMAKERRRMEAEKLKQQQVTEHLRSKLQGMIAPHICDTWRVDLLEDSYLRFDSPDAVRHDFIKCLFSPEEVLWLGDQYDSGKERHKANFKTCRQWLELPTLPPRIAPSTFNAGVNARSKENILSTPYIVIESDEAIGFKPISDTDKAENKRLNHAITRYLQRELGLTLRAVLDTGNRSLHSWFDMPPPDEFLALRQIAEGLNIDLSALDGSANPFRLPYCKHSKTNNPAQLLFLNPKFK